MNKKTLFTAIALIATFAIIIAIAFLIAPKAESPKYENGETENKKDEKIRLFDFEAGQTISSPLSIKGEAQGTWYFEASFPVRITDGNGNEIGLSYATALSDWMTEEFVEFESTINFTTPTTETGFLILEKDNPSGLPEHYDEIIIPIRFQDSEEKISIKVFFSNSILNPDAIDCGDVFAINREIPKTQAVARAAILELLSGLTEEEKNEGFFTSINEGVEIQSLEIEDGTAKIDLSPKLDEGVGGSCRVTAIRAQIEETLKQFPTVENVIISINGETDLILQP